MEIIRKFPLYKGVCPYLVCNTLTEFGSYPTWLSVAVIEHSDQKKVGGIIYFIPLGNSHFLREVRAGTQDKKVEAETVKLVMNWLVHFFTQLALLYSPGLPSRDGVACSRLGLPI